jgi:hypothetical protein
MRRSVERAFDEFPHIGVLSLTADTAPLAAWKVRALIERACAVETYRNKKVLLIVADATRLFAMSSIAPLQWSAFQNLASALS